MINLYDVLNVSIVSTKDEIEAAYNAKKACQNDRHASWLIDEAYSLLIDDVKRAKYDKVILKNINSQLDLQKSVENNLLKKSADESTDISSSSPKTKRPIFFTIITWYIWLDIGATLLLFLSKVFEVFISSSSEAIVAQLYQLIGAFYVALPQLIVNLICLYAINKRYTIAIKAILIPNIIRLIYLSLMFALSLILGFEDLEVIYCVSTLFYAICLIFIINFLYNVKCLNWLSNDFQPKKERVKALCYIVFCVLLFVMELGVVMYSIYNASNKQVNQVVVENLVKPDESKSDLEFLETSGDYDFFIDGSQKIITIKNGYVVLLVMESHKNKKQVPIDVQIDTNNKKFCFETNDGLCKYQPYDSDSAIEKIVVYVESINTP